MLKEGMYVRCAVDDEEFPRDFALGKIKSINEFSELAKVVFFDISGIGEFYSKPGNKEYNINKISHINICIGASVKYKEQKHIVKQYKKNKESGFYYYYIQSKNDEIAYVSENEIETSYNEGQVYPLEQLKNYEFQNPMWFFGRSVVSKTLHVINNSMYGFSVIAGCKIYLKTHQLRTVIRCLQDSVCRNMIADEVGMGKTIEASSILKVFLKDHHNCNILIIVPNALIEQWRTELAFKFKILEGNDINGNNICLIDMNEIEKYVYDKHYDFIIADEVHKYLLDASKYKCLLELSKKTDNILMLSATPVQQRKDEYKKLLQLIQPSKYETMTDEHFKELLELQGDVVRRVHSVFAKLDSYLDEIEESENEHTEDTKDEFDDVIKYIEKIQCLIKDDTFQELYEKIDYESSDFGVEAVQGALAYVCENYQFEKAIIRNRRDNDDEDDYNERQLVDISYDFQSYFNNTEYNVYTELANWIEQLSLDYDTYLRYYKMIVASFFSSAAAFEKEMKNVTDKNIPEDLQELVDKWVREEQNNLTKLNEYMDEPTDHTSRMNNILDYIDQEAYDKKVLVFTSFDETFLIYKMALENYFGKEHCTFFSKYMEPDERELNAYRFETDEEYGILLSDETGGEGRNFQNADIVIHIDIPFSANDLEQRIGRLDRIGRKKNKPVISVVCYARLSLEEDLFKFWNDGIGLFKKSQSGLEIIMNDMDEKIIKAVCSNFKYGLIDIIEEVSKELEELKQVITQERYFDIAEYKYQTINRIMDKTREMYVLNEKQLFADSMMRWSALAGFHASRVEDSIIRFDSSSFSLKSAYNTLFIPPNIKLMINNRINQIQNKVRTMNCEKENFSDTNYVQGTFERQLGLENDYIHFFAPGDEIFDSIVKNALGSYKGTCAAFECKTEIDWIGLIFTWILYPDETILLENGLTSHVIDKYRGFMPFNQFQCAVGLRDNEKYPDVEVLKVFNCLMTSENVEQKKFKHLGSRSNSNIELFLNKYPEERWKQIVEYGYKKANENVKKQINKKMGGQLVLLKNELLKDAGARKATDVFYSNNDEIETSKLNNLIYKCFSKPKIVLDSVCYSRMINDK